MAERRTSWPWRKKNPPKVDKLSLFSPSPLSNSAANSDKFDEEPTGRTTAIVSSNSAPGFDDGRVFEANTRRKEAEDGLKNLRLELTTAKEEVKQHQKVAEDAISGWEKAEKEALSYKQQFEVTCKQKSILEDRVAHLDGALKECMRQVRHVKEEQAEKIEEVILSKTREWEKIKAEVDARQVELERRLMESDAQNNVMSRSLQERAKKIIEANEAKAKAETEVKVLQVKLSSSEKDMSSLKYELHVLSKELEIRNEEVEYIKKSADAAHKQHLDNVKKMANLEADCQRLRNLLKKKLPGPAAIAQMRKEVEGLPGRDNGTPDSRRRPTPTRSYNGGGTYTTNSYQNGKEIEMLRERMLSMEEENNLLKEALTKRNGELQASRLLCAKTASKLSVAEDQLESLQGTPRDARVNGFDFSVITVEPSIGSVSVSEEESSVKEAEEASCAESWASALISELAHIKKDKPTSNGTSGKDITQNSDVVDASNGNDVASSELPSENGVDTKKQSSGMGSTISGRDVEVRIELLSSLCKDLGGKLGTIEEQLRANELEHSNNGAADEADVKLTALVDAAHQKFNQLEKAIQGMGNIADHQPTPAEDVKMSKEATTMTTELNMTVHDVSLVANSDCILLVSPPHVYGISSVLSKLLSVLDTMVSKQCSITEQSSSPAATVPPTRTSSMSEESSEEQQAVECADVNETRTTTTTTITKELSRWERQKEALVSCKDSFLQGKASLLEFLVRLGILLCEACNCEWYELEQLLQKLVNAAVGGQDDADAAAADVGYMRFRELSTMRDELASARSEIERHVASAAELEKQLTETRQQLDGEKQRLSESEKSVAELESQLAEVKGKLEAEEAAKAEVAAKLQVADVDVGKLQASVASLTVELADQKKLHEGVLAKCEDLEHKLQSFSAAREDDGSAEDASVRKERELVAAKEKLTECQRTILVLGKQLTALSTSSPSGGAQSPTGGSFDTVSMDSASLDQRMMMTQQHQSDFEDHAPHHRRTPPPQQRWAGRRYNDDAWRGPPSGAWYVASGPQPPPGGEGGHHSYEAPPPPNAAPFPSSGAGPVYISQRYGGRAHGHFEDRDGPNPGHSAGAGYMGGAYLPADEEDVVGPMALTVYSPPHTATSSPAVSPARYAQQVGGGRRAVVRTSLTDSMNAAAGDSAAADAAAKSATEQHSSGNALGRLFRSKKKR